MKVAIIIPTMGRADFIERTLAYYDSLNCPHPIYIGDASGTEISTRINDLAKRYSNVVVRYFHWERLGISQTIVKLAEIAQTECQYCAFHGDDDYFVPASLSRCAEFLSISPDYRTAQGRAALFTLDRPGPYGEIQSLGDYWGVNFLEQNSPIDRFASFDMNYFVTQFSTHRTEEFVQDSRYYLETNNNNFSELLHCFTFAIRGKSKFLDCLYLIRSFHEGVYHPSSFMDMVLEDNWVSDYHKTVNALGLALSESSNLPLDNARKIVTDALKLRHERWVLSKCVDRKVGVFSRIKRSLPAPLKNYLRQLTTDRHDMRLLGSKKSFFYQDFLPVLNSISDKFNRK